jgi:hypothetical protein
LTGAPTKAVSLDDVRLLAPVQDPDKILCIGLNYHDHAIFRCRRASGRWASIAFLSSVMTLEPVVVPAALRR